MDSVRHFISFIPSILYLFALDYRQIFGSTALHDEVDQVGPNTTLGAILIARKREADAAAARGEKEVSEKKRREVKKAQKLLQKAERTDHEGKAQQDKEREQVTQTRAAKDRIGGEGEQYLQTVSPGVEKASSKREDKKLQKQDLKREKKERKREKKLEDERLRSEETERRAKAKAEAEQTEQREQRAKEEAERRAKAEEEQRAKEEAEQRAKEAREETEAKARTAAGSGSSARAEPEARAKEELTTKGEERAQKKKKSKKEKKSRKAKKSKLDESENDDTRSVDLSGNERSAKAKDKGKGKAIEERSGSVSPQPKGGWGVPENGHEGELAFTRNIS